MNQNYKIRIISSDDKPSGICAHICSFLWGRLWPFNPTKSGQQQETKEEIKAYNTWQTKKHRKHLECYLEHHEKRKNRTVLTPYDVYPWLQRPTPRNKKGKIETKSKQL